MSRASGEEGANDKALHKDAGIDMFTSQKRSEIMSQVRGKNTKPELKIRSLLHRMGYRFRLHCRDLPGNPDIVLPKYRTVVFVHGCFWHQHPGCRRATTPKKNSEFWEVKLRRNRERDQEAIRNLRNEGWSVVVLWECEILRDEDALLDKVTSNLQPGGTG